MATGRYEKDDTGEWIVYDDVPVFDQHVGDDGVEYDARLLARIAKNNNERIEDTGDYCPVVIGHTSDDDKSVDPPVIGLAGPFRLGKIGRKRPRWSILGRFRIRASKNDEFLARPRRSVEIWPEDKPEKRYFDPIAVLGAETPKRDLGLVYSRRDPSKRVIRYEMGGGSVAGMTNTSVGGMVQPARNGKEIEGMLSPEDIQQIVEAMRPTIMDMIQAELGGERDQGGGELPEDDIMPEGDEAPEESPPVGDEEMPPEPAAEEGGEPDGDEEAMGKGLFAKACSRYSLGSDKADMEGARGYFASMDDSQRGAVEKYCNRDSSAKALYEKCCSAPRENYAKRARASEIERYRKAAQAAESELAKAKRRYQRSQESLLSAQDQIVELRQKLRYAKIDGQLAALEAEGYAFDREEELKTLISLPDDLVEKQIGRIAEHYAKVPAGMIDAVEGSGIEGREAKAKRYSKAAATVVQEFRSQGHRVDYGKVLNWMYANGTDAAPRLEDVQSAS